MEASRGELFPHSRSNLDRRSRASVVAHDHVSVLRTRTRAPAMQGAVQTWCHTRVRRPKFACRRPGHGGGLAVKSPAYQKKRIRKR